jgi:hypothetical protein
MKQLEKVINAAQLQFPKRTVSCVEQWLHHRGHDCCYAVRTKMGLWLEPTSEEDYQASELHEAKDALRIHKGESLRQIRFFIYRRLLF